MVFVQKDVYPKIINTYIQSQKNATKISHYNPVDNVKPMKETTNLIENSRMSSLKNAPIRNSDKQRPPPRARRRRSSEAAAANLKAHLRSTIHQARANHGVMMVWCGGED